MEAKLRENWEISKYLGEEIERKQKKLRAGNTNTQFLSFILSLFNMYSYQLLDDTTVLESSVQEHQVLAILLVIED